MGIKLTGRESLATSSGQIDEMTREGCGMEQINKTRVGILDF